MSSPITRAEGELMAFDQAPDLRRLRAAAASLSTVNLLLPDDPAAGLSRRSETLRLWLSLLARLDGFALALSAPTPGDLRSATDRNRLMWRSDAIDAEVSAHAGQFIQRYYTPSPVDRDELALALTTSNLSESRRRSLLN